MTPVPPPPPAPRRPRPFWGFVSAVVVVAAIVGLVGLFALTVPPSPDDDEAPRVVNPSATVTATATAAVAAPSPDDPATSPAAAGEGLDVARIIVPDLGIDAPIVTLGVDPDGTMQSPDNPTDVAWYNFSARPGEVSNVVMSGHLDYINHGPAVFYRLKDAQPGDEVELRLVDGSVARYRVSDVTSYDEATAPVLDIVGPTDKEMVTLITCDGSFDPLSREYDKRVVLRAERVDASAQGN